MLDAELKKEGKYSMDIRNRECGRHPEYKLDDADYVTREYSYVNGKHTDYFISAESRDRKVIFGFLRLRIPIREFHKPAFECLEYCALIRELHVYGEVVPVGFSKENVSQHKGVGTKLLKMAEDCAYYRGNLQKVAVISDDIYKQLFEKDENSIGDYIQINSTNFKVIGVFQEQDVNMGPSSDVHIPFTTFQQLYNTGDRVGWMVITGKSDYNIRQIEEDVKLLLRNLNKIHPRDNRAFGSFNLGKEFAKITGFLTGMQFLTWFVGIATLIAGVFAIGNILLITVKERTKEIGVRRALGATPFEIKRQIVVEAIFLTLVSGILGIITGGWILIAIDNAWGQGEDATLINASVSIAVVFIALLVLVVLGTIIGLIPAFKATSIKPIQALREE